MAVEREQIVVAWICEDLGRPHTVVGALELVFAVVDANGDARGAGRPDTELDAVVDRQCTARPLPHLCGQAHSAGRSQTTASGGSVTVALNGWSCQPGPSAATLPMFPMPLPL